MDKRRKWQKWLIVAVLLLTAYNILPTVFYYSKPLKKPISKDRAEQIIHSLTARVNQLETDALDWVHSFCNMLDISPKSVKLSIENPQWIEVHFNEKKDTQKFCQYMPKAGSLIPFLPAQLYLPKQNLEEQPLRVTILRQIPLHLESSLFSFAEKFDNNQISPFFEEIVTDRVEAIIASLGWSKNTSEKTGIEAALSTYQELVDLFGENSLTVKRFFLSAGFPKSANLWNSKLDEYRAQNEKKITLLGKEKTKSEEKLLKKKDQEIYSFLRAIKQFKGSKSLDGLIPSISSEKSEKNIDYWLADTHHLIEKITVDWNSGFISFHLHQEIKEFLASNPSMKHRVEKLLLAEFAEITKETNETISQDEGNTFQIPIHQLEGCQSCIALALDKLATREIDQMKRTISTYWQPSHPDLAQDQFPVYDYDTYASLPKEDQLFCLVIYSPQIHDRSFLPGCKKSSLYIIPKGLHRIAEKYEGNSQNPSAQLFFRDFAALKEMLHQSGFQPDLNTLTKNDGQFLFEQSNFWEMLLLATREKFTIKGSSKYAILEMSDVEQRILTQNQIDTAIHEDLLKAKDEYLSASTSLTRNQRYSSPPPIKSPFWNNLRLSMKKYFRGDERKVLKWGLDLSGGKTVMLELRDQKHQLVEKEEDLSQAVNELHTRVNKMGLSEVTIRQEGNKIALDFPGSQNLSAEELVKASTMSFHLVNEKFSTTNSQFGPYVNQFLQEVWNEALVRNEKDAEKIHKIAVKHFYGEELEKNNPHPRSEAAKILYDHGLRLATEEDIPSTSFNDSLSKIAMIREEGRQNLPHPLMIVFNNYALDGSSLQNIHASYDTSKGNYLSFEVKPSLQIREETIKPRESFYQWTSTYCKEKIAATENDYLMGKGWRMAVILNGTVISSPTLDSALKESAMITGGFSQREVNLLVADLKAGSLSFTPKILSEKNVSPELGQKDRMQGIIATCIALILVIAAMVGYYRFAGVVASVAVILNLIIMWAILQNLNATLTLAGIAAIILTLGMAVDANVLVFERVKEEFSQSGRIALALQAGYKKAFTAIFDSNLTTILAALILLNFDSGPIKAFAVTLIIGIATSMFTALFLTRFFFVGWIENPRHDSLKMSNWIKPLGINFLRYWKISFAISALLIGLGCYSMFAERSSILGMDFTGGYTAQIELNTTPEGNYRANVEEALTKHGANMQEIEVRELSPSNHLRLRLSTALENEGRPFHGMVESLSLKNSKFAYQSNPRLNWIVQALQEEGITIPENSHEKLAYSWSSMSGQLSKSMRNQAAIGLALALLAIFIYINVRFEFTFAIAAIVCVLHDILITLGVMGLLHAIGLPLQLDLHAITAIMTIIGYSLNDTIIIFDRIREELKWSNKKTLSQIINSSLNTTLSRTTITSGTTLLVLIALVALGGGNIFNFSMVMTLGVIFGTLSSLFIASPLVLFMHLKENKKEKNKTVTTSAT